jgi:hypothetical protein
VMVACAEYPVGVLASEVQSAQKTVAEKLGALAKASKPATNNFRLR